MVTLLFMCRPVRLPPSRVGEAGGVGVAGRGERLAASSGGGSCLSSSLSNYLRRGFRVQRVLSGSFIVTSVYVFSVEFPDRFESPDLLEPDC